MFLHNNLNYPHFVPSPCFSQLCFLAASFPLMNVYKLCSSQPPHSISSHFRPRYSFFKPLPFSPSIPVIPCVSQFPISEHHLFFFFSIYFPQFSSYFFTLPQFPYFLVFAPPSLFAAHFYINFLALPRLRGEWGTVYGTPVGNSRIFRSKFLVDSVRVYSADFLI